MILSKWEQEHRRQVAGYQSRIRRIFGEAVNDFVAIYSALSLTEGGLFSFDDYPFVKRRVDRILKTIHDDTLVTIVNGVKAQWTLANNKNSELSRRVFGALTDILPNSAYKRYFSTNDQARDSFLERKTAGLGLSDRVWKYTDQFRREIELGLDVGIRNGLSADKMTAELRDYLQHPDKLFRRVRDEHGDLQLSKAAKEFHPGRGVYRSSYRNAVRLAGTETNMAYRTADYERWQKMDFVVGIEIVLSNNHTTRNSKGETVPLTDICDELAGRYPKDFKFTGWHPNCRCHVETILKTKEEMAEDTRRILRGEEPSEESVNTVKDVPDNFKNWVEDNEDRIERAKNLPFFLKDNESYWKEDADKEPNIVIDDNIVSYSDIAAKIEETQKPREKETFVSFEPFSPVVIEKMSDIHDNRKKVSLFYQILNDERASELYSAKKAHTTIYPTNKGKHTKTWNYTKRMAIDLNEQGRDVVFLPEYAEGLSADAMILFKGKPVVADFKYSGSTNWNTLSLELVHGFRQAGTIVLKLDKMDVGSLGVAIGYLARNEKTLGFKCGNIVLINRYGKCKDLTRGRILNGKYVQDIKGFL